MRGRVGLEEAMSGRGSVNYGSVSTSCQYGTNCDENNFSHGNRIYSSYNLLLFISATVIYLCLPFNS